MARTAEVKRDARIGEGNISNYIFVRASKKEVAMIIQSRGRS